jgi:hypothetical protein
MHWQKLHCEYSISLSVNGRLAEGKPLLVSEPRKDQSDSSFKLVVTWLGILFATKDQLLVTARFNTVSNKQTRYTQCRLLYDVIIEAWMC